MTYVLEGFGRVLFSFCEDDFFTTRMLVKELRHVVNFAVKEDPEIMPLIVLLELFVGDDTFCGHYPCYFPGKVYDVAKFLDEHPGGEEVIFAEAGKDATESFEDVGHSDEARDILKTLFIGTFGEPEKLKGEKPKPKAAAVSEPPTPKAHHNPGGPSILTFLLPLAALGAYFAWRFYG